MGRVGHKTDVLTSANKKAAGKNLLGFNQLFFGIFDVPSYLYIY